MASGGGGSRVEVDHGNGLVTTYNHLNDSKVTEGDAVAAGQVIATVGTSGSSTGCHLHFETILNGRYVDPNQWQLIPLGHVPLGLPDLNRQHLQIPPRAERVTASPAERGHTSPGPVGTPTIPQPSEVKAASPSPVPFTQANQELTQSLTQEPSARQVPEPTSTPTPDPTPTPTQDPTPTPTPDPTPTPTPARELSE